MSCTDYESQAGSPNTAPGQDLFSPAGFEPTVIINSNYLHKPYCRQVSKSIQDDNAGSDEIIKGIALIVMDLITTLVSLTVSLTRKMRITK